jgi:hypothetical protein
MRWFSNRKNPKRPAPQLRTSDRTTVARWELIFMVVALAGTILLILLGK